MYLIESMAVFCNKVSEMATKYIAVIYCSKGLKITLSHYPEALAKYEKYYHSIGRKRKQTAQSQTLLKDNAWPKKT